MLTKLIGGAAIAGVVIAVTNRIADAAISVGVELGGYINRSVNNVKEKIAKAKTQADKGKFAQAKPVKPAPPTKKNKSSKTPSRGR